jgi:N-acetylglucosamine malate deacetylase 1
MKPIPTSNSEPGPLLVFGAHPDDIEFGCGAIVALETRAGRRVHLVVCSKGEAGTYGSAEQRVAEAQAAAKVLGASLEFVEFDGDAHLELRAAHAITLARRVREHKPDIVLAPTVVQNQHPDHWRLGTLVRDAVRLARYGGLEELRALAPHRIEQLFFYALGAEAEPHDAMPILVDVSPPEVIATWTAAMQAHASQVRAREYVELQLSRAHYHGLRAGVSHAIPLFPNDPILLDSLAAVERAARAFLIKQSQHR